MVFLRSSSGIISEKRLHKEVLPVITLLGFLKGVLIRLQGFKIALERLDFLPQIKNGLSGLIVIKNTSMCPRAQTQGQQAGPPQRIELFDHLLLYL